MQRRTIGSPGDGPGGRRARHHHRHRHRLPAGQGDLRLREPGRARADLPGARGGRGVVPARAAHVAPRPSGRSGAGLPDRRRRRVRRGAGRRGRLDGPAARGRRDARHDDGRQQRLALRRHRPGQRADAGAGALHGGVGDDDRRRRGTQPDRASRRPSPTGSGSPSSPARSRSAASACCWPPWSSGCGCVPTRCCSPAAWRASRTPAPCPSTSWGRVVVAVRERPVLLAAVVGLSGAHAAMVAVMVMTPLHMEHGGRRAPGHRHRDQRARARHVRLLAGGRLAGRPRRALAGAGLRWRACCSSR